jgi:hypothetical protein
LGYLPYSYFETYLSDAWFRFPSKTDSWLPAKDAPAFTHRTTMFSNALGNPGALIDLWDIVNDIRIGWCMMTLRDGMIDIEDIFLRHEHYGSSQRQLFRMVLDFAVEQDFPVRLWFGFASAKWRRVWRS